MTVMKSNIIHASFSASLFPLHPSHFDWWAQKWIITPEGDRKLIAVTIFFILWGEKNSTGTDVNLVQFSEMLYFCMEGEVADYHLVENAVCTLLQRN